MEQRTAPPGDAEERAARTQPSIKKRLLLLALFLGLLLLTTAVARLGFADAALPVRIPAYLLINLTNGALALLFLQRNGMRATVDFKNMRQYGVGILLALSLLVGFAFLPLAFGIRTFSQKDFVLWKAVYTFFNCLLVIGPVEELGFREYVQGTLLVVCRQRGWLAVVLTSLLFGLWHYIFSLNLFNLLFTTLIGAAIGFVRLRVKNGTFLAVALGHGLYDALLDLAAYLP